MRDGCRGCVLDLVLVGVALALAGMLVQGWVVS